MLYELDEHPSRNRCRARKTEGKSVCLGGGGGGSGSSSSNTTTTETVDKRMVVDTGVGISSESSTVTVNALDSGITQAALDVVKANDATNGQGFEQLLGLADKLFTTGSDLIGKTQSASLAQLETINTAANDKTGSIDQKTMIVLAIAGAAAIVMTKGKF
jgi:hypothetical protein